MEVFGQFLLNIVLCGLQVASIFIFANHESRRPHYWLWMLPCAACALLYAALTAKILVTNNTQYALNALIYTGMFSVTILWTLICYRDAPLRAVYNIFSGILLRLAISSIANFPLLFLPDTDMAVRINWLIVPLMHFLVGVTVLLLLDRVMIHEIRENKDFVPGKTQIGIMVLLTSTMLAYHGSTQSTTDPLLFYGVRAIFCLLMLMLFYLTWKQARILAQNAFEKRIDEEQLRHYADLADIIQAMNIKAHDLRHQIRTLETGTVVTDSVISDLTDSVKNYENYVHTGNATLDVILTEATLRCERAEIEADFRVTGEPFSLLPPADLNALFGNAIDNAIEYLVTVPKKDRLLWIQGGASDGFIKLRVENRFLSDLPLSGSGLPETTKPDKLSHGFGTQSIRSIAERYGGSAVFSAEDEVFTVSVILPLREQ